MKAKSQRDALKHSEKAAEHQPENFKDEETEDKTVEIGPDLTDAPIHGIDPPQRKLAKQARGGNASANPPRDDDADERPPRTGV